MTKEVKQVSDAVLEKIKEYNKRKDVPKRVVVTNNGWKIICPSCYADLLGVEEYCPYCTQKLVWHGEKEQREKAIKELVDEIVMRRRKNAHV